MAIIHFKDRQLKDFIETGNVPKNISWKSISKIVMRKIDMLHYSQTLGDLRASPGNRLEALKGDLLGYFSIRINDQWRIIFRWTEDGVTDVEVLDYHF